MHGPGRKRPHLPSQHFVEVEQIAELRDSLIGFSARNVVERGKQTEVFPSGETRIETGIGAAMEAELPFGTFRMELTQITPGK